MKPRKMHWCPVVRLERQSDPSRSFNSNSGTSGCNRIADRAFEIDSVPEEPRDQKESAFDGTELAQGARESILPGVARELAKHERGCHRTLLE